MKTNKKGYDYIKKNILYTKGGNMKKNFKYFGLIVIAFISFLYTEKAAVVVKNVDIIMHKIKDQKEKSDTNPIQAIIRDNTIVPGVNGYEIDINKSYQKMRYIGEYNENYLVYNIIKPTNTLKSNMDKVIISGNSSKKEVSLVLILKSAKYIESVKNINHNLTIFVDGKLMEENIKDMAKINSILGTIGYNYNYNDASYPWLDSKVKELSELKNSYCLVDSLTADTCDKYNNYTIYVKSIKYNHLLDTKKNLIGGKIFVYDVNDELIKELESIIRFVESKGYKIVKINDLLKE